MKHIVVPSTVLLIVLSALTLPGQVVIDEDFEDGVIDGNLLFNSMVVDPADGVRDTLLSMTQGANDQRGFAWFNTPFNLRDENVTIDFDFYIRTGVSAVPADGMSVIFQFGSNVNAEGGGGGGLGTCNFPSPYVSVGFDIWDNRETNDTNDPNIPPCYDPANTRACHVEVNQNICPGAQTSTQTNAALPAPGNVAPDFVAVGDTLTPIHAQIIFDNGLIEVFLQTDGDPAYTAAPVKVISVALAAFPDPADAIIGFAASTGGANAHHEIDNLTVVVGPSRVTYAREAPRSSGAINCGGPAVNATSEVGAAFAADGVLGTEVGRTGDLSTGLVITTSTFGRVPMGDEQTGANPRPIDVSQITGAGAETAKLFANEAWSTIGVRYQAEVVPGRYDVSLYFSEGFGGVINGAGQGTRVIDVLLNGTRALCNWSAAAAAGSGTGSGDPNVDCNAVLDTAIRRTFSVSVPDGGAGFGVLDILLDDLGGGNPPDNPAIQALSFNRTGNADGGAVTGDLECITLPPAAAAPGIHTDETFDAVADGECPPGMACNFAGYAPQGFGGRLKMLDDATFNTGNTAIFESTVNVKDFQLEADFDVYMANPDAVAAADGGTFFVMQGNNVNALGVGGGGIGVPFNAYGFAVEFDTWLGGGNNEPSGFNDPAAAFTHVGINNLSTDSVITNVQYDSNLRPLAFGGTGWPNFFDPEGVHFRVTYNTGRVTVELTGVTAELAPFGPTVVAEADVPPIYITEAVVGFSGGTGGATQTLEIDNVIIEAEEGTPASDPIAEAIASARNRWIGQGELYINSGGGLLACSADQFPAPQATGDPGPGDSVVWLPDLVGGGALFTSNEFFSVTPLLNSDGSAATLQVAGSDMGLWDARGTAAGVDDNDSIFHTERWAAMEYGIPVTNGSYEVTLYFANSFSGTAGTGRRVYHVDVEGERKDGFDHCEFSGQPAIGGPIENTFFGFDTLFDPVDAAEALYSSAPCEFASCANNDVTAVTDPDGDRITAEAECGNAAAVALRYVASVADGILNITLTPPDVLAGEPASPDGNPKISGIAVKRQGDIGGVFRRGDSDTSGQVNLTDAIRILNVLFLGIGEILCDDAADSDDSGDINLTDAIRVLNVLFLGIGTIGPPGVDNCGPDPTADGIECAEYAPSC